MEGKTMIAENMKGGNCWIEPITCQEAYCQKCYKELKGGK